MSVFCNQVGYFPTSEKIAIMTDCESCQLYAQDGSAVDAELIIKKCGYDEMSGDNVWQVDFSALTDCGTYYIEAANGNRSPLIHISENCWHDAFIDMNRMFYFQRCGCDLTPEFAGKFVHKACHCAPVTESTNPAQKMIINGGWHDAGDYGRYTTPGAVTVGHLLYSYELFPKAFTDSLHIPESGNNTPDILNECRYELEWLLKMQYEDGSVSHKLTSAHHTGFMMPENDPLPFFRYPATSPAAADFAACMAQAYRAFLPYDQAFAEKMLAAAKNAWTWLVKNPDFVFAYPENCHTGGYGYQNDRAERLWAAAELYRATNDDAYLQALQSILPDMPFLTALGWGNVSGFAGITILFAKDTAFPDAIKQQFRQAWIAEADRLLTVIEQSPYHMATPRNCFFWGSNMDVMYVASILSIAALLTGEAKYRTGAEQQTHYLLGRNPLNISYVTGHGSNPFRNPHNRPTAADGIDEPIPGFVSGGPNQRLGDACAKAILPEGTAPMKCHVDEVPSYSTNEIAIYWNSMAVLGMAGFIN